MIEKKKRYFNKEPKLKSQMKQTMTIKRSALNHNLYILRIKVRRCKRYKKMIIWMKYKNLNISMRKYKNGLLGLLKKNKQKNYKSMKIQAIKLFHKVQKYLYRIIY